MSATYWDQVFVRLRRKIQEAEPGGDERVREAIGRCETEVGVAAMVAVQDQDFPADLRARVEAACADTVLPPLRLGWDQAKRSRSSPMIERIHAVFHELPSRQPARWGPWSEDPEANSAAMINHDLLDGEG